MTFIVPNARGWIDMQSEHSTEGMFWAPGPEEPSEFWRTQEDGTEVCVPQRRYTIERTIAVHKYMLQRADELPDDTSLTHLSEICGNPEQPIEPEDVAAAWVRKVCNTFRGSDYWMADALSAPPTLLGIDAVGTIRSLHDWQLERVKGIGYKKGQILKGFGQYALEDRHTLEEVAPEPARLRAMLKAS